ncbi:hypothetical protein NEFER03_0561 [Nematocida sp. LUAm3]|nr:hypothetical protein NEFER03_0561 [Nematocida sp. LUAm3]KAI5175528.1 hypothetical protein NEFER02_1434 [Nematocida sp. LUAm2]KAI5178442.1 hypothetical protein NEFER01_1589 [Nematocida sp. LUAm1]
MYAEKGKYRVIGDIERVIDDIPREMKCLIVTPLLEDKLRLEKSYERWNITVKRIIEAENSIEKQEICPEVVIVDNYSVVKDLELFNRVLSMGIDRVVVITDNHNEEEMLEGYSIIEKEKTKALFYIETNGLTERMSLIFAFTKLRPIRGVCAVFSCKKELIRCHLFLEAFGIHSEENPSMVKDGVVGLFLEDTLFMHRYLLIVDFTMKITAENTMVIWAGSKKTRLNTSQKGKSEQEKKFASLLKKALLYKYRIESVLSAITMKIIQGKEKMNFDLFKHLKGPLKVFNHSHRNIN